MFFQKQYKILILLAIFAIFLLPWKVFASECNDYCKNIGYIDNENLNICYDNTSSLEQALEYAKSNNFCLQLTQAKDACSVNGKKNNCLCFRELKCSECKEDNWTKCFCCKGCCIKSLAKTDFKKTNCEPNTDNNTCMLDYSGQEWDSDNPDCSQREECQDAGTTGTTGCCVKYDGSDESKYGPENCECDKKESECASGTKFYEGHPKYCTGNITNPTTKCGPNEEYSCVEKSDDCANPKSSYDSDCKNLDLLKCCDSSSNDDNDDCPSPEEGMGTGGFLLYKGSIVPCGRKCDDKNTSSIDESKDCTLCHLIIMLYNIFRLMIALLIIVALVFVTVSGTIYILSTGNSTMKGMAKNILTKTLTGFAVVLLSWLIVFTVLKFISAKTEVLGNAGDSGKWYEFTCDTTSAYGGGGGSGGGGEPESKKCSDHQSEGYYCINSTSACKDDEEITTKYSCDTGQSCCGPKGGTSSCSPTNNGCGGLSHENSKFSDVCNYTSTELADLLSCIDKKGIGAQVRSITLNEKSDWCDKCAGENYTSTSYCEHAQYSCHFGGTKCVGTSQAADLIAPNKETAAQVAVDCKADTVLYNNKEWVSNTSRSDIGHTTHVHVSVNNSKCGCDWKK